MRPASWQFSSAPQSPSKYGCRNAFRGPIELSSIAKHPLVAIQLLLSVLHSRRRHHYGQPVEEQHRRTLLMQLTSTTVASAMPMFGKAGHIVVGLHFFQPVAARSAVHFALVLPGLWPHRISPSALNIT